MTIGIGATGPKAGLAVFEALRVAELVSHGAIGGFVTYAAIGASDVLFRHQTQRGGSKTLFIDGEVTGTPPPEAVAEATAAAVISSGPERPEPLSQFLAAEDQVGLVTGHRLPNGPSISGQPLNLAALELLRAGQAARQAVDSIIETNPEADVGLIAVDCKGGVYARNSARVARRPDLGHARRENTVNGAAVEVLHNAIRPAPVVAELAASVALEVMEGAPEPDGWAVVETGIPLELGEENALYCDDDLRALRVTTTDPLLTKGRQVGAAIYLASQVYREKEVVGLTMFEPIATIEDGIILEMSGQKRMRISFQKPR